ncbi:hypothetical protein EF908_11150, partial [Streptomyces sp. WAC04770]
METGTGPAEDRGVDRPGVRLPVPPTALPWRRLVPHRPRIPSPGRRTVLRGSLLVPVAAAVPAGLGAAPA